MMKGVYMISIDFPQCALRADFQKYTRLALTYDLRPMLNRLSSLRCNHRTHVSIANGYDGHGRSLGQRSAMYPPAMSALLAQTFATAIFDKRAKEMQTVVAPAVRVDMPSDQSMGLEHILVGNHLFSQNTVRFRHVWQGIIPIGNTNAFMIISR